jgi:hypothetical protein
VLSSNFHSKKYDGKLQKQIRVEVSQDMLDSTTGEPDFMNTIITGDESWVYGYDLETNSFRHFPYNQNPMRALDTTSLKSCLPLTDAIDRREKFTHAYEGSRSPNASAPH